MSSMLSNDLAATIKDAVEQMGNLHILIVFVSVGVVVIILLQILHLLTFKTAEKNHAAPTSIIIKPSSIVSPACQRNKLNMKTKTKPFKSSNNLTFPLKIEGKTPSSWTKVKIPSSTSSIAGSQKESNSPADKLKSFHYPSALSSSSDSDIFGSTVENPSINSSISSDILNVKAPAVVMMKGPMTPTNKEVEADSGSFLRKTAELDEDQVESITQSSSATSTTDEEDSDNESDNSMSLVTAKELVEPSKRVE